MAEAPISSAEQPDNRPPDTDTDLVDRARRGDPDAFGDLYRMHVGRVYAICLRMCSDRQRAERLTQDAFVRCWERIETFRGESRFSSWLYRLAVNVVINDQRARDRRRLRVESVPDLGRYGRTVPGERTEEWIDVERALAGLPDSARQVLVLYAIEGYKYREIAGMTGLAEGTVKARIHRARQLLTEALEGRG